MKLLSLNKKVSFFFILFFFSTDSFSEEGVDIWNKKNLNKDNSYTKSQNSVLKKKETKINLNTQQSKKIEITLSKTLVNTNPIYGIYEPSENNLTLDMWSNSEGTRVKDTIERIDKIKLSSFSEELFLNTLFTISELPGRNITEEEFINYKIDWLIKKKKRQINIYIFK